MVKTAVENSGAIDSEPTDSPKEIIFFLGGGDLAEDGGADRFSGCFGLDVSAEGASVSFFETTTSSLDWAFFLATSNFFLGGTVVVSVAPAAAFFFGGFALRFFPCAQRVRFVNCRAYHTSELEYLPFSCLP